MKSHSLQKNTRADDYRSAVRILQRKCACGNHTAAGGTCDSCQKQDAGGVPESVHSVLRSEGRPLDAGARAEMEPRFGRNFADVRVHTGSEAAQSARDVNAHAYTVGNQIAFNDGRYEPNSPAGQHLLAHELTHVAQQQGGNASSNAPQTKLEIGSVDSPAEREADRVANQILLGQTVSIGASATSESLPLRRAAGGAIATGLIGAGIGAGIGSFLGPLGAVIGGLIGGIAGLIAGDIGTSEPRPLTSAEQTEAEKVFGSSLDYSVVRVTENAPLMSSGENARTPGNTVYFPKGSSKSAGYYPFLIHELTHCWQTQHGISLGAKLLTQVKRVKEIFGAKSAYDYGGPAQLIKDAAAGKKFTDYNTEQQGDILSDYYRVRYVEKGDYSAYLPFIRQVNSSVTP